MKEKEVQVQEKVAFDIKNPKIKNGAKVFVEKGAEGLGRTLFPAAITVTTGRNIMNSFKEIDDKKESMQEDMANKIVININSGSKRSMKKQVSSQLDAALKKSASEELSDLVQEIRDENELMKPKKKLQGRRVHLGNGIKKQFKMNEMHGTNPLHPQF